jgi:hypothetical protein
MNNIRKKGAVPVWTALAAILFVLTVAIFFGLVNTSSAQTPSGGSSTNYGTCSTGKDCVSSDRGMVCIAVNTGPYLCGCLTDDDCTKGRCSKNVCG